MSAHSEASTEAQLHILQHSLGLDSFGGGNMYRNHFVTGPGTTDYPICQSLVQLGLMQIRPVSKVLTGGSDCFVVTPKGIDWVALHSPTRPPERKLTRSQKNYRAYLAADSGFSFGEWIRLAKRAT